MSSGSPDEDSGKTNQPTKHAHIAESAVASIQDRESPSDQDRLKGQDYDEWTSFLRRKVVDFVSDEFDLIEHEKISRIKYVLLPEDTFSLLALPNKHMGSLFLSLATLAIQFTIMVMVLLDIVDLEKSGNPFGMPPSVEIPVRVAQLIALFIAVISQPDVADSAVILYNGYDKDGLKEAVSTEEDNTIPGFCAWVTSTCLRFAAGSLGLFVTFILIMRETNARDVLLNFAAIEFVANLDNVAFSLAQRGYFGEWAREDSSSPLINSDQMASKKPESLWQHAKLRFIFLIFVVFLAGWSTIVSKQRTGAYQVDHIFVQFGDEFVAALSTFSGAYRRDGKYSDRPRYTEVRSAKPWLGYCKSGSEGYWALTIEDNPCEWIAKSTELSSSFDIMETASVQWFVRIKGGRIVPLQYILMAPFPIDNSCGSSGSFDGDSHTCECNSNHLGLQCEFQDPCETLVVDVRRKGFLGDRTWSSEFNLFRVDGKLLEVYYRPVYLNDTGMAMTTGERRFEIILFTGRRWTLFERISTRSNLNHFLRNFHAFFSDEKNIAFVSGKVDVFSPGDRVSPIHLQWFHANGEPDLLGMQSADFTQPADVIFLCGECDAKSNNCLNNGVCQEDRTCECNIGSLGALCEDPPIGNGRCDPFFNTAEFEFDGGDCCESTCVSTSDYLCGKDETGYSDLGYPLCKEKASEWKPIALPVPGSRSGVQSGSSVALSRNGAVLAVGEPAIATVLLFYKDGSKWNEGPIVEGPQGTGFGSSVVMVDGGISHFVSNPSVSAPVTISVGGSSLRYWVNDCTILGCFPVFEKEIVGPVGLSRDGQFFAIIRSSEVVVYTRKGRGSFSERSSVAVSSDDFEAQSLSAVAISKSGSSFAVMLDLGSTDSSIQQYEWNGSNYELAGPGKFLQNRERILEFLLSDDGMVLAMLVQYNVPAVYNPTKQEKKPTRGVEVYEWISNGNTTGWSQRGASIRGMFVSMDMSAESNILALGMGHEDPVRIYQWQQTQYKLQSELPGGGITAVSISENGSMLAVGQPSFEFGKGTTLTYGKTSLCGNKTAVFRLSLTLDSEPEQTSWALEDGSGQIVDGSSYSGGDKFATIVEETCLVVDECYKFGIFDTGKFQGAGLSEPGAYSISWNGKELKNGRSFNLFQQVEFGRCDSCEKCVQCASGTTLMKLAVHAKEKDGTSWRVVVEDTNESLLQGGNYNRAGMHIEEECLRSDVCLSIEFKSDIHAFPEYTLLFGDDIVAVGPHWGTETVRFGRCKKMSIATRDELIEAVDIYLSAESTARPFSEMASRYGYPIGIWNVSQVKDFSEIFHSERNQVDFDRAGDALKLFNEPLDGWDVSRASSMTRMFRGAQAFNQNLSTWDVSGVQLMNGMFDGAAAFVGDGLSVWDTSRVTNMRRMFRAAVSFNANLGEWNVASVTNTKGMFNGALSFRGAGIGGWEVSQLEDMRNMFNFTLLDANLCPWGDRLPATSQVSLAFNASGCPMQTDPDLKSTPPGPFCFQCS